MGDNKKKNEIINGFGKSLLELDDVNLRNQNEELSNINTTFTLPEFENKEAQDSWDSFAKAPLETKLNSFLKENVIDEKKVASNIELKKNVYETKNKSNNNLNVVPSKKPHIRNNLSLNEKKHISNIETIAVTMLHNANVAYDVKSGKGALESNKDRIEPEGKSKKGKLPLTYQNLKSEQYLNGSSSSSDSYTKENENKLGHIEQIRIAQNRISQLEKEVETLKWDNEKIGAAAQLLQKKCEELNDQKQKIEGRFENIEINATEENKVLKSKIDKKTDEYRELKSKFEDLESRLAQDIRRSGGRERDLENRLELIKMEKISLVASKDEIILNLKRQIDQLQFEVEGYRKKTTELQKNIEANDEQIRRTVRALRLALTNLDQSEESKQSKKVE